MFFQNLSESNFGLVELIGSTIRISLIGNGDVPEEAVTDWADDYEPLDQVNASDAEMQGWPTQPVLACGAPRLQVESRFRSNVERLMVARLTPAWHLTMR